MPNLPNCCAKGCVAVWTSGTGEDNPGPHSGQTRWIQCCGDERQVIMLAYKTLVSLMLALGGGGGTEVDLIIRIVVARCDPGRDSCFRE